MITNAVVTDGVTAAAASLKSLVALGRAVPDSYEPEFEPTVEGDTIELRKVRRLYWNDNTFWHYFIETHGIAVAASHLSVTGFRSSSTRHS